MYMYIFVGDCCVVSVAVSFCDCYEREMNAARTVKKGSIHVLFFGLVKQVFFIGK